MIRFASVIAVIAVAGCASHAPAPVIERTPAPEAAPASRAAGAQSTASTYGMYTVKRGDTLYSIALEHGQDYKDLKDWNGLEDPNRIRAGQQLRVAPAEDEAPVAVVKPVTSSAPVESTSVVANRDALKREPKGGKLPWSEQALAKLRENTPAPQQVQQAQPAEKPVEKPVEQAAAAVGDDAIDWAWPTPGKPMAGFAEGAGGNKGIDIAGRNGEPVGAAADGKVVYVGSGLRGYGNLVIVRHNATYLSAYGHNSTVLVKEGQAVTKGQKIAEMGNSDADRTKLHFEIRRQGKPIDPLKYLPPR